MVHDESPIHVKQMNVSHLHALIIYPDEKNLFCFVVTECLTQHPPPVSCSEAADYRSTVYSSFFHFTQTPFFQLLNRLKRLCRSVNIPA